MVSVNVDPTTCPASPPPMSTRRVRGGEGFPLCASIPRPCPIPPLPPSLGKGSGKFAHRGVCLHGLGLQNIAEIEPEHRRGRAPTDANGMGATGPLWGDGNEEPCAGARPHTAPRGRRRVGVVWGS